jgi:DNA-binding transcriptional MerR regulator/methylmalonyl-CoA mutase cobalamin-binding subunit
MYTIKQAASRTGLSIPTIRMWERRYGIVQPNRSAGGYRLFDDEAIDRLAAMRILVEDQGWRPSQAAEHVAADGTDLATILRPPISERDGSGPAPSPTANDDAIVALVEGTRLLDMAEVERTLDEAFAAQRFEHAMDRVVFPALRSIGDAWAAGEIDVAAEHAASETVRRRLSRYFDAAGRTDDPPAVIVGMPPAAQHELGSFAFAVACRRRGVGVAYLGSNVPGDSWIRIASDTVRAIVLGVVTRSDAASASIVVDTMGTLDRPPTCFVGGPASAYLDQDIRAVRLPDRLDDAVDIVVGTIRSERRQPA